MPSSRTILTAATTALAIAALMLAAAFDPEVFAILRFWSMHALSIGLAMLSCLLISIRVGVTRSSALAISSFLGMGLLAYACFWMWFLGPQAGMLGTLALILAEAVVVVFLLPPYLRQPNLRKKITDSMFPLGFGLIWALSILFFFASGWQAIDPSILKAIARKFFHHLPVDNEIPYIFAEQLAAGKIERPMIGDWLSSDRPPLQTGFLLASGVYNLGPVSELNYLVNATCIQQMWIVGLLALLSANRIPRSIAVGICALTMLSATALINGIYTWPKLLPVAYILLALVILLPEFEQRSETAINQFYRGAALGCSAALAMLSHGASAFAILGIAGFVISKKRMPSIRLILSASLVGGLLLATWSAYQAFFDPPGSRLLKWHLAGTIPIDSRGTLEAILASYSASSLSTVVGNKVQNLGALFGEFREAIALYISCALDLCSLSDSNRLRLLQFFHLFASIGPALIAAALLLVRRSHAYFGAEAIKISFWIGLLWILMMFGPGTTVIHQGTLVLPILLAAGGFCLLLYDRSWLAYAVIGWHCVIFLQGYLLPLLPLSPWAVLASFATIFLAGILAVSWVLSAETTASDS